MHISFADLVYAEDICSPAHLQALIDALVVFCDPLHTDLEQLYARHLGPISDVRSTTGAILLAELGLLTLQVFWWRQTLKFFNKLVASPVDPLFHVVLLDNLHDAFACGAKNFCNVIFQSLAPLLVITCLVTVVLHLLMMSLSLLSFCRSSCRVVMNLTFIALGWLLLLGLSATLIISGLGLSANIGVTASCCFRETRAARFVIQACLTQPTHCHWALCRGTTCLIEQIGFMPTVEVFQLLMSYTWYMSVLLWHH